MSIDYISFGEKVKGIRKSLKLRQGDVTAEVGISQETLRRIENGIKPPTLATLEKLSIVYKRDLIFLLSKTRTKTDLFSEEIVKEANKLLQSSDFSAFRESVVEIIDDLHENFEEGLFEDNKSNFINYLNSVKDIDFIDARDKSNNIQNLKSLVLEISRSRKGLVEDPFYFPLEISILVTLSVILRRNGEIDESIEILEKLYNRLDSMEILTEREVDFLGAVVLNIANAYFRQDRYQDVVDIILKTFNSNKYSYKHMLYSELNFRLATAYLRLEDPYAMSLFETVLKTTSDERRLRYCKTLKDYYKIEHKFCSDCKQCE